MDATIEEIIEAAHSPARSPWRSIAPSSHLTVRSLKKPTFRLERSQDTYGALWGGRTHRPRAAFAEGDPFLAGGGAVNLVELDDVVWNDPPDREEAGSPNVVGAVALHAAIDVLTEIGWPAIMAHDSHIGRLLRNGLTSIPGVRVLGPDVRVDTLPVVTFTVEGLPHGLVAARLSAENGIGVRHGCFCAHPYMMRLLGLAEDEVVDFRNEMRQGDRTRMPGAVRASAGINTTEADVSHLLSAVARIAAGAPARASYVQDPRSGDYIPCRGVAPLFGDVLSPASLASRPGAPTLV